MAKYESEYRFLREEKDSVIDQLRTEAQRQGNLGPEQLERIAYRSGVAVSTLKAWWFGQTMHPQNLTVKFVAEALGLRQTFVREDGTILKDKK